MIKKIGSLLLLLVAVWTVSAYAQTPPLTTPMKVTLQLTLSSQQDGLLEGRKNVIVGIYNGTTQVWTEFHSGVLFINGATSLILGNNQKLTGNHFYIPNPRFGIQVDDNPVVYIPIPSTPYSIQSRIAETVKSVDASRITGAFTTTVNIQADLTVGTGTLTVDNAAGRVGIGQPNPQYELDVNGAINASGYKLNGQDLEAALSWQRNGSTIFYNQGFVGIGTANPTYDLDIAGTLNAREFRINGVELSEKLNTALSWKQGVRPSDIYFNDGTGTGRVGIGTMSPSEQLDVSGGIRIGETNSSTVFQGTMQYRNNDFIGFTNDGWVSLTGIKGSGTAGQITYWTGANSLGGNNNLYWDNTNNRLGIGTNAPEAHLHIAGLPGDVGPFMTITNGASQPLFIATSQNVGIGTANPTARLQVAGVVDAQEYKVNGQPLQLSLSSETFWLLENENRLFYDLGNVGIGTNDPQALLELAANPSRDPSIIFDIGGQNLFTIGIDAENPDAFIIGKGGNLDIPVFVFRGDKIGVGIKDPSANLQVSGNAGVLFTGTFGSNAPVLASGPGTRFMWHPARAALRAGFALGDAWDDANVASYSVGLGFSPLVTGEGAVAIGGYRNIASGLYSAAIGGFQNEAIGDYSVALGHRAIARHRGSFVWSDYTPTLSVAAFQSAAPNQFLIRANNGTGIGTNDTLGSGLTIARNSTNEYILRAKGNSSGENALIVNTSGNVGIGTATPGTSRLAVMGGNVGIGITNPTALLTVSKNSSVGNLFHAIADASNPTPGIIVITASGNVGIGQANPQALLDVRGTIRGTSFQIVDPNNPSLNIELKPNPGSPWAIPSENANNTFFTQGFVGIGTPSPNSLLELSDRAGLDPVITFDFDGIDKYSLGVTANLFTIQPSGDLTVTNPPLAIATAGVGIGTGYRVPSASLHVIGTTIISGNVAIGTNVIDPVFPLVVSGSMNVDRLFLRGQEFIPKPSPWKTNTLNQSIYFTSANVGIGTADPRTRLEVLGTISANAIQFTDPLTLNGSLSTTELQLQDTPSGLYGRIYVENGDLKFQDPITGNVKVISSPLRKDANAPQVGFLSYWVDASTLGISDVFWNGTATNPLLAVSGNFTVQNHFQEPNGFEVTTNTKMGSPDALAITARLNHEGDLRQVKSFTAESIEVNVERNWGNINNPVDVKGLNINFTQANNTLFLNNARAIGLYVDVASVNVDAQGAKAAALFMGGNVGIGTTQPQATLEVNGTVSANFFNLTGGLQVPELAVGGTSFIAKTSTTGQPRVGIGTLDPQAELDVRGNVSANTLVIRGGITSTTMNINNGSFFVNQAGNIGIGTLTPNGQIEVRRLLTTTPVNPFISEKVSMTIDGAEVDEQFFFNQNLTGMDVRIQSQPGSQINTNRTAAGVSINMSNLTLAPGSKAIGLNVNVGTGTGTRYAAIFENGRVGIGLTEPLNELHVSGSIRADNLFLEGTLSSDRATFNFLTVNQAASFNGSVTINELQVLGTLTANSIVLLTSLDAPEGRFGTINANTASINTLLRTNFADVATTLSATTGFFRRAVGINTAVPATGLNVSGNINADNVTILNTLTLNTASMNINNGSLFVHENGRVGVGTLTPTASLDVVYANPISFSAINNSSWNPIRVQTRSNANNSAAGILLVPDNNVPSNTVGSGIIAVRSNDSALTPGSHLVFVTDPSTAVSAERMRITAAGNVGIGTITPLARWHVAGDGLFNGNVTANGTLSVGTISNTGPIVINPLGTVTVSGNVSANNAVIAGTGLYMRPSTPPGAIAGYGRLYVNQADQNIYYVSPGNAPFNISAAYNGTPGKIPYFNSSGYLSDTANLRWNDTTNTFIVGSSNVLTSFEVVTTLNNLASGNIAAQKIELEFDNRSTISAPISSVFTGMDIEFSALNDNPFTFGRLAQGETAIGLRVDVSRLQANQSGTDPLGGDPQFSGFKYAALFLGGSVGVGTTAPQAAFHVESDMAGQPAFRVDLADAVTPTLNALLVTGNGRVGIGTASPASRLSVVAANNTPAQSVFSIYDSTETIPYMLVQNDGKVGINTALPSANLHVNGTISANVVNSSGLIATTLNVGNGNLFIDASGNIGVGTATPSGNISFVKSFTPSSIPAGDYTSQRMNLLINGGNVNQPFFLNRNITGIDILTTSLASNQLQAGNTATGVSINMSQLAVEPNSTVTGLFVDVTGSTGTRYAAIFNGGFVGIGTANPTEALHVSGNIKANSLILNGSIAANQATINRLTVAQTASFNGTVSIANLTANTVSLNNLVMTGTLSAVKAIANTLNATTATFNQVGIGLTGLPTVPFDVSGNARISGNTTISGILTVPNLASAGTLTVNVGTEMLINGTVSVNNNLLVGSGLLFKRQTTAPVPPTDYSALYVNNSGDLIYRYPNSTNTANLSEAFTGTPSKIPYYNANGSLSSGTELFWNNTTRTFRVGTSNVISSMEIVTTLNNTSSGTIAAEKIMLEFQDRSALAAAANTFTGLQIDFTAPQGAFDFGRLAQNETAVGLRVDVSDLRAKQSDNDPIGNPNIIGYKYAALFLGGSVGIGTTSPLASLHVSSEVADQAAFRVDTVDGVLSTLNALIVTGNGFVGIGTGAPDANLAIVSNGPAARSAFTIYNSTQTVPYLYAANNGNIGLGLSTPQAQLHVTGNSPLRIDSGARLNALVVTANGNVGVGLNNPTAALHVSGNVPFKVSTAVQPNAIAVNTDGNVGVGIATPLANLHTAGKIKSGAGASTIPAWVDFANTYGFLAHSGNDDAFFGLKNRNGVTGNADTYDTVILWGDNTGGNEHNLIFENTNTGEVARISQAGNVGIGIAAPPSANLHLKGTLPLRVDAASNHALVVSNNGFVGVNTKNPSANLHVLGTLTARTLGLINDTITVSTLNVNRHININRTLTQNRAAIAHDIAMNVSADISQDLVGLNIVLDSLPHPAFQPGGRDFTLYNAIAYGLKVDVRNLEVQDPNLTGSAPGEKYAAVFLGGNVGIGTETPAAGFQVVGPFLGNIARFGTTVSDLTFKDYNTGSIGLNVRNLENELLNETIMLRRNQVGIGTTEVENDTNVKLTVNGDVRVGIVRSQNNATLPNPGYGNRLLFSGAPVQSVSNDNENTDPLWIARYNAASDESELRVNIGDNDTATFHDRFIVGYDGETAANYKKVLIVTSHGRVGINDGVTDTAFAPQTTLHVKGATAGTADDPQNHLVLIENTGGNDADSLVIYHSGFTGTNFPSSASNFITFARNSTTVLGEIEGTSGNGVRFKTTGADYAEYLEKVNPSETIEKGDIVGIVNGKITKDTTSAQHIMVRSTAAGVAGNWPGKGKEDLYELIAFFGQVPVKVIGPVQLGDFILPSGQNDGTGIAVSPSQISLTDASRIVGRAWQASDDKGAKKILTAVGFNFSIPSLKADMENVASLQKELYDLKAEQRAMKMDFEGKLNQQNQELESLLQQVRQLQ